ncbi:40S ribosomal protein S6 [Myotis davidii]|uniref:40S ribosomal protein S6 n=1 Tax=Myotis davidii TaxID=225400 RepID=L5MGI7_MYODS|nr:40S ribosomal protein S6 [Myotis davidii]
MQRLVTPRVLQHIIRLRLIAPKKPRTKENKEEALQNMLNFWRREGRRPKKNAGADCEEVRLSSLRASTSKSEASQN